MQLFINPVRSCDVGEIKTAFCSEATNNTDGTVTALCDFEAGSSQTILFPCEGVLIPHDLKES